MKKEEAKIKGSAMVRAELARREMARRYFRYYLPYTHGDMWKDTRFSRFLADEVQDFAERDTGHAYDLLIINTPPQHGKSMTVTQSFPSWYIGKHPDRKIIMLSYNDTLAEGFLRRNRQKVQEKGGILFGISTGKDTATDMEIAGHTGFILSRGIMGGITGNGADLIIIDDPIKNREEADSETYRGRLWEEWLNSIRSRLSAGAKVILIMTPWHEDDISARLLLTEKHVRRIRLPVEAEEGDPMGRAAGEPLCPEIGKGAEWLAETKEAYFTDPQKGQRAWQALYQCSPRTEGGNLVHRDWWRFYKESDLPDGGRDVISVDATFKDGESNDYVAVTVWRQYLNDFYLRYCLNKHLDFPGTVDALRTIKALYPSAQAVLIEDKANGSAIIQTLQKEMFCIPVNPLGGKVSRVNAVAPAIQSGHVYLPDNAPWLAEYMEQWTAFPAAAHDDMVDSSTQAISYLLPGCGFVEEKKTPEEQAYEDLDRMGQDQYTSGDVFYPYGDRYDSDYYDTLYGGD